MSWLEPTPPRRKPKLREWRAPTLTKAGIDINGLSYVVVEEIIGGVAGLSVSAWPGADWRGRLRFAVEDDPVEVSVTVADFCDFLNESLKANNPGFIRFVVPHHRREKEDERQLRIGTTFAAEIPRTGTRWSNPLDRWIKRIYDITADARDVAKLATYGALTEHWNQEEAAAFDLLESEEL